MVVNHDSAETRAAFRPDHHSLSRAESPRTAHSSRGSSHTCCIGAAIRAPRLCGLLGLRLQRKNAPTAHQHATALNKDEYLKRWGLWSDHPLAAPAYSERRSTLAKALGLGRKPKAAVLPAVTPRPAPTPVDVVKDSQATPARGRRSRSAAKSVDSGNEMVAEPKPARKRGSRSRFASPKQTPSPIAES
jgi:hypothetical protein